MRPVFSRWLITSCLALATAWTPVAPPEHAHESEDDTGIHRLVHSHTEGHFGYSHHDMEHAGVVIDHDDAPVLMLDSASSMPSAVVSFPPSAVVSSVLLPPPDVPTSPGNRDYVERLIHGPPRAPTGLRAPPLSSRL